MPVQVSYLVTRPAARSRSAHGVVGLMALGAAETRDRREQVSRVGRALCHLKALAVHVMAAAALEVHVGLRWRRG